MPANSPSKCISNFDFKNSSVDLGELTRAWDAALEEALSELATDTKVNSFLIAGVKLGLRHQKVSAKAVAVMSGYSLSTFFRSFPNIDYFADKGFFLVNSLIINIYKKSVSKRVLTLNEHVDLFLTLCVGAYAAYPPDILQRMSTKYHGDIEKIHPHTQELSEVMVNCLHQQAATRVLQVKPKELEQVLFMLDRNLMQAALRRDDTLVSPRYFNFLYRILYGFLKLADENEP